VGGGFSAGQCDDITMERDYFSCSQVLYGFGRNRKVDFVISVPRLVQQEQPLCSADKDILPNIDVSASPLIKHAEKIAVEGSTRGQISFLILLQNPPEADFVNSRGIKNVSLTQENAREGI
jgi:hypothetical protein